MRPIIILAVALGGLLAATSTSKTNTLGYTLTDINVPGAYVVLSTDNLRQVAAQVWQEGGFPGFQ
jgi:hypothetical protein